MILIITVILISLLYSWVFGVSGKAEITTEERVRTTYQSLYCIKIDNIAGNRIYLRNCGPGTITRDVLSIFLNGKEVPFVLSEEIQPNKMGYLELPTLWRTSPGKYELVISAGSSVVKRLVRVDYHPSALAIWTFDNPKNNLDYDIVNNIPLETIDGRCWAQIYPFGSKQEFEASFGCADEFGIDNISWKAVHDFCKSIGGYLPVISSHDEFLGYVRLKPSPIWLGLYQDPDDLSDNGGIPEGCTNPNDCWKWVSDETSNFFDGWTDGEPSGNTANKKNCGVMNHTGFISFRCDTPPINCWTTCVGYIICESNTGFHGVEPKYYTTKPPLSFQKGILFLNVDDGGSSNYTNNLKPRARLSVFISIKKGSDWNNERIVVSRSRVYDKFFYPKGGYNFVYEEVFWKIYIKGRNVGGCVRTVNGIECVEAPTGINDLEYHLIGMTYNGTHITIYFDNKPVASKPHSGRILYEDDFPQTDSEGRLNIGRNFKDSLTPGNIYIDNVMIFSEAIAPTETITMS
ncbi:MAG: hypothetical protein GXO63_02990 [Candidatus Micrarchaeota archaeon]|nr:hypothetical protein [Candidatus Micrarchaeota archaeon]